MIIPVIPTKIKLSLYCEGSLDAQGDFDNLIFYVLIVDYIFLPIHHHSNIFTCVYLRKSAVCLYEYAGLFPLYLVTCKYVIDATGSEFRPTYFMAYLLWKTAIHQSIYSNYTTDA